MLGGAYLYYRRAAQLPVPAGANSHHDQRRRVLTASLVTTGLLLLVLLTDVLGL